MKIAVLGPQGTFSEATLKSKFTHFEYNIHFVSDLDDLFSVLDQGVAQCAWLPWWNSGCGFLTDDHGQEFLSLIIDGKGCYQLVAEAFTPLEFALASVEGATVEELKTIHVNPYVTSICKTFFKKYPDLNVTVEHSSSAAANKVKQLNDKSVAAAASINTCHKDGLTILQSNMATQDEKATMQFIMFTHRDAKLDQSITANSDMTSFVLQADAQRDLLKQSKLDVYCVRQSAQLRNHYLVDVRGIHQPAELTQLFNEALVVYLGHYQLSPLHPQQ